MVKLTVTIFPKQRKRLELIQSLYLFLESLNSPGTELLLLDKPSRFVLLLDFENREKLNLFFAGSDFEVMKSAAKTLGTQWEMLVDGEKVEDVMG